MRVLKNKILWLAIYTVLITGVFLYLLFPASLVLQRLEASAGNAGMMLKASSLQLSLPAGIALKNLMAYPIDIEEIVFQGEFLNLQIQPTSLFSDMKRIRFAGRAYGGIFDGHAGVGFPIEVRSPFEGDISFSEIDLGRLNLGAVPALKGLTGKIRGSAFYATRNPSGGSPTGKVSLYLIRGAYPLPEPFLGINSLEFDRGEIQAQLENNRVTLKKFEVYGRQLNCTMTGTITTANRPEDSLLDLKGMVELVGKNKLKMNITVGGTLANPSMRYM